MNRLVFSILLTAILTACNIKHEPVTLTILHTNDTHSQVEPRQTDNRGGYARRMGIINKEREADKDLILLDAGDFWQGTPYFNYYKGEVEIEAMNRMHYDAVTLGNHEFDNGVRQLAEQLKKAQFAVLCANYNTENSPLQQIVKPYTVIKRKGLNIGIIGIGVKPHSLIASDNFYPLQWVHPYAVADSLAHELREKKHCDVVILLSHLGTQPSDTNPNSICDINLAKQTSGIDLIIGGHSHRIENLTVKNKQGKPVLLTQAGKSGINIGKVTLKVK